MQKQLCIAATELEELKRRQQQLEVKNHTHEHAQAYNPAVEPDVHVNQTHAMTEVNPGMITITELACKHKWSFEWYLNHTV